MFNPLTGGWILAGDTDVNYMVRQRNNWRFQLSVHRTRPLSAAVIVIAFTLCGCANTLAAPTLTPAGAVRVPAAAVPIDAKFDPRSNSDAVRLDFTASPELLANDDALILSQTFFCDTPQDDRTLNNTQSPMFGDTSIRHGLPRRKARAAWASGPNAHVRPVYSVYVYVDNLSRGPKPICFYLTLDESYTPFRPTTNTLTFSAEQIAAALR
jgi:hypothetical protein